MQDYVACFYYMIYIINIYHLDQAMADDIAMDQIVDIKLAIPIAVLKNLPLFANSNVIITVI